MCVGGDYVGKVHQRLPSIKYLRWELLIYFGVYFAYLIHGFWILLEARYEIIKKTELKRDPYNEELDFFNHYIHKYWIFYVLHILGTTVARIFLHLEWQSLVYAGVSVLAMLFTMNITMVLMIFGIMFCFIIVWYVGSKKLIWIIATLWILVLHSISKYSNPADEHSRIMDYYTSYVIIFWTLLRGICYADHFANKVIRKELIKQIRVDQYLGYMLYFPTLANGPFMTFERHMAYLQNEDTKSAKDRLKTFVIELLRVAFWWIVLEMGMRYIFVHYMASQETPEFLVKNPFSRHAVGYFLGQFFFMTYLIKYGLGIAFARLDGMSPPDGPKCIGHIHYYSDMWKQFDVGLYEFLHTHIYLPLREKHSAFVAAAATFSFVFVWHGCYNEVAFWALLNFLCLMAEKLLKEAVRTKLYEKYVKAPLGEMWSQRLYAVLASQVFIIAAFSNIFFIGSEFMGQLLLASAYSTGFWNYAALSFCCYCFFQCSEVISLQLWRRKANKDIKDQQNDNIKKKVL